MEPVSSEDRDSFIYHSNKLDGVTLTEGQTHAILEGEIKPEEDVLAPDGNTFEAANVSSHWSALQYVQKEAKGSLVSESLIRETHRRLMDGVILTGGEYREYPLKVKGFLIKSPPERLKDRMERLVNLLNVGFEKAKDKGAFAWRIHHEFVTIHPFVQGNGRMARLILNLLRFRAEMPIEIIKSENQQSYLKSIIQFQQSVIDQVKRGRASV